MWQICRRPRRSFRWSWEMRAPVSLARTAIASNMLGRGRPRHRNRQSGHNGGFGVRLSMIGSRAVRAAAALLLGAGLWATLAAPAAAQIVLGSPADPPRIALGAGAFDVTPSKGIRRGGTAGEVRAEYRF